DPQKYSYLMFFSFMIRFNHFSMANMMSVATIIKPKFTQKKLDLFSYPSHKLDNTPESLLPMEVERNQPPIISAVMRGGLSFETNDNPIGLSNNSPTVITPYVITSHHALAFSAPLLDTSTAMIITNTGMAEINKPNAILVG